MDAAIKKLTVKQLIVMALDSLGADGLVNYDAGCACGLEGLDPYECLDPDKCEAARRVAPPEWAEEDEAGRDWYEQLGHDEWFRRNDLDRKRLKLRLQSISNVLDNVLGDSDPLLDPDMTCDEMRQEEPIFWACKELNAIIEELPE